MKLYATTTSERATKGQGGNDKLEIHVTQEEKKTLAFITVLPSGTIVIDQGENCLLIVNEYEKGEKKKDETPMQQIRRQAREDREHDAFNAGMQ